MVLPIICELQSCKYKAITNNTLFDDSLPLDDEMELEEDKVSSNEELENNKHFIITIGNACIFTSL